MPRVARVQVLRSVLLSREISAPWLPPPDEYDCSANERKVQFDVAMAFVSGKYFF